MAILCNPADFNLRDASFRGVPFYVETDAGSFGRRIAKHEFINRDDPYFEDLGEKAAKFTVNAYLAGDDGTARDALRAACLTPGPGILILPAEPPLQARCSDIEVNRSKNKLGWFDVKMTFEREGASDTIAVASILDVQIDDLMDAAETALGGAFAVDFSLANGLDYLVNNAVDRFQTAAALVVATVEGNPVTDTDLAASLVRDSTIAAQNAGSIVTDDGSYAPVTVLRNIVGRLGDILAPADSFVALRDFTTWSSVPPSTTQIALNAATAPAIPSDGMDAVNELLLDGSLRILGFIQWCRAAAQSPFSTRSQAIQARADIAETAYQLQQDNTDYVDVVSVVTQARDLAIKAVTQAVTTLNPVVELTLNESMPSLYLAYRLYQDPTRAQELVDRNDVAMPSFMPTTFEALTS